MAHNDFWTDHAILKLRDLWEEKLSIAEIGRRLGTSKNSIVGKAPSAAPSSASSPAQTPRHMPVAHRRAGHAQLPLLRRASPGWYALLREVRGEGLPFLPRAPPTPGERDGMTYFVTELVTKLVAERHRLIGERERIMRKIAALADAIALLQEIECPEGGAVETRPEPGDSEVPQTAPVVTSLSSTPAPEAIVSGDPIPAHWQEKAATFTDAPPQQVEVPPKPPAATLPPPAWATPARQECLRKFFPKRAITSREIVGQLAAYDGPRIPDWGNISRYAIDVLGLPATNRSHSQQPDKSAAARPISYHDLIAKAAEWGITEINPDDLLKAVNAKAVRIGHKPYALQSRSP